MFGIEPDITTCAKGLTSDYLPLGACILSGREIERITWSDETVLFSTGYIWCGHPVSCRAGWTNIAIMERRDILAMSAR